MQMPALKGLLKMREAHMPPQPQVLASIIGSHSRLGSITDSLAQMLQRAKGQAAFKSAPRALLLAPEVEGIGSCTVDSSAPPLSLVNDVSEEWPRPKPLTRC